MFVERLLSSQSPIITPFSQEECGSLLDLLNRFDSSSSLVSTYIYALTKKHILDDKNRQVDPTIQTRVIAKILLRVGELPFFCMEQWAD